jgi:hypothetical protein
MPARYGDCRCLSVRWGFGSQNRTVFIHGTAQMSRQVSELYRTGIVRPIDRKARDELETFHVSNSIRCEWLPILDDFAVIWQSGLLQAIGGACGRHFTDYKEIMVSADQVCHAVKAVGTFLTNASGNDSHEFAESLFGLLKDAESSAMPVLFVL